MCWALLSILLLFFSAAATAFSPSRVSLITRSTAVPISNFPARLTSTRISAEASSTAATTSFQPLFDFTSNDTKAIDSFERIDDAIMGGISTSYLREVSGESYAAWSGVCRTDGGGFCGTRTLPFKSPLMVGDEATGFYLDCRLSSDDEPNRRVWKMVTRTEASRGEEVYQASYKIPKAQEWVRIQIPFSDFRQVRGPRLVPDGVPLNATGGLYQIGLSLSKFVMSQNPQELENFRPGYFELQLRTIGVYGNDKNKAELASVKAPITLNAKQAKQKQPMLFKMLRPVFSVLFSETKRRRRSALKILREKRGLSRWGAVRYGIRKRAKSNGWAVALAQTAGMLISDCLAALMTLVLRLLVFYPIIAVSRISKFVKNKRQQS